MKRFKIVFACLLILFSVYLSTFSTSAASVNPTDFNRRFNISPFSASANGKILDDGNNTGYDYNIPLPSSYVNLTDNNYPFEDTNLSYSYTLGNINILSEYTVMESNTFKLGYWYSIYNRSDFVSLSSDLDFLFLGSYLTSTFDVVEGSEAGVSFVCYDNSIDLNALDGQVHGDFMMPGSLEEFSTSYDYGAFLSYYAILVNSDVPWSEYESYYNTDYTVAEFELAVETAKSYDFLNLTNYQLSLLRDLFHWIGVIHGDFQVRLNDEFTQGVFTCYIESSLVSSSDLANVYEVTIEKSSYAGLTGLERVTRFIGSATSGFLNLEIMPGFSFSGVLVVFISFSLVLWWLKVFAGG